MSVKRQPHISSSRRDAMNYVLSLRQLCHSNVILKMCAIHMTNSELNAIVQIKFEIPFTLKISFRDFVEKFRKVVKVTTYLSDILM